MEHLSAFKCHPDAPRASDSGDPLERKHSVQQRRAQRARDVVLALTPIQALQRERSATLADLLSADAQSVEPPLADRGDFKVSASASQPPAADHRAGHLHGHLAGQVVVARPRVPNSLRLFVHFHQRRYARGWRKGREGLDESPYFIARQAVVTVPSVTLDREQLSPKQ